MPGTGVWLCVCVKERGEEEGGASVTDWVNLGVIKARVMLCEHDDIVCDRQFKNRLKNESCCDTETVQRVNHAEYLSL